MEERNLLSLSNRTTRNYKILNMKKTIQKLIAFTGITFLLVSCGGHATCDAYSYIKYKKEKQHIQVQTSNPDLVQEET